MSKWVTRLFDQFQPETYDLQLDIDKDKMSFSGTVTISGKKIGRPSKRLTFHQKGLKIKAAVIVKQGKHGPSSIEVERINHHGAYDEVRLHTKETMHAGEYTATMEFSGKITKSMHGIYPCFYKHRGKDKTLIASQFESHHAREAFPCIDEPEAKATFDLTLVSPAKEVAIANTPALSSSEENGRLITSFETSPKMSTYLLAFVIGEMHSVSGKTKDGIVVSSWSTVAQKTDHLKYANKEAIRCLEFFTNYFKTPFPLKKLDQVALPDFEALAMENWGLITYREVGLLADPLNRSLSGEQLITLVIAHEVSHQWFGDLVTMKWWDDLWLNESFASIMENIAPDRLHPDWQQWEDFATGRVLSCSHRDIYKDVQPVGVVVKHPDEIATLFDPAIVYAKGARLLNMLYEHVGEETFVKGLQDYFKRHAYGNTTRHDLWQSMAAASKSNIDKFMTPWIQQSGQPVLSVKRVDDNTISLTQKRFLMDGDDNVTLWPIPLLADTKLDMQILDKRSGRVKVKRALHPIFNVNGNGHYIVRYEDEADRDYVRAKIVDRSVGPISRITILNDMLLLARAGEYNLSDMLDVIRQCSEEPRDAVWSMFSRIIGQAQALTDGDTSIEAPIRRYKAELSQYWYNKLGWTDKLKDDPNAKHLRTTALALAVAGENPEALDKALKLFAKAGSVEKLPAEQRALVAGAAVRHGKASYVDQLMKEYVSSPNPDVQQSITVALCSTRDPKVAKKLISWGLDAKKGVVRDQDIDHWFAYLMRNHYSRDLAWQWFVDGWKALGESFAGSKHMEYFIWYSSGPVSTRDWQLKFKKFFEPKMKDPSLKRNIQIALSEIEARVLWREREESQLLDYFSK